jgi:hypothetical protein
LKIEDLSQNRKIGKIMNTNTNIAIIGFGSIVNNLHSDVYNHTLQIEGSFDFPSKTELSLPIRMSRQSSAGTEDRRITVVVDPHASPERVGVARSAKHNLSAAIEDLRRREGTIITNICYLAKANFRGLPSTTPHTISVEGVQYAGNFSGNDSNYHLTTDQTKKIAVWLKSSGYDAVIWTGLSPNIMTTEGTSGERGREILPLLRNDPTLLINTQRYISQLPDIFKTTLQKKILSGDLSG